MDGKPLVSVLLPFYNSEKYLNKAITSIINQTYSNFELILLDDGSLDNSLKIAQLFFKSDPRIYLYHHLNMGISKTLQKGVNLAKGKYIARMDGDDIAHPERLKLQVEYLEQEISCVALGTAITIIDPEDAPIYQPEITLEHDCLVIQLMKWNGSRICHPTVMMRTEAVKKVGGYIQSPPYEDVDLFLKLTKVGYLANLPHRLLQYRWQLDSISHNVNKLRANEIRKEILQTAIQMEISANIAENELAELLRNESFVNENKLPSEPISPYEAYRRWCLFARKSGYYCSSLKYFLRLFSINPFSAKTYWTLTYLFVGEKYGSKLWQLLLEIKQYLLNAKQLIPDILTK